MIDSNVPTTTIMQINPGTVMGNKASTFGEDLESKRQKLVEGGAAFDSTMVCTICNIACNSQVVFNNHLAGKRHAIQASLRPNGAQTLVAANPNPLGWSKKPKTHPAVNGVWKKGAQKTKIVQSAWCEICKIDCNSKDVLEIHKLGKKHKKNLEKLEESKTSASAPAAGKDPMIGPKENPAADKGKTVDVQQSKKKGASSLGPGEDLETKRRKLMEGGAAADAVRVCPVCNVVCNSQTVFNYHLAGQKHINMVKKQAALAAAGTANPPAGPGVVTAA
ncbi:zinc finger matrin-type protein 3-like isoform X2 [Telopea speciosissima]|uniref:zinc finger matrin-type protein 3-like isoform X2 n=1 Tax=Telopea speciosissima TaxID=54955 RepID=UPI001CC4D93E|nr:zinc finger matrin-type protein 3-like isoform X2 [Telopea speciosissima]